MICRAVNLSGEAGAGSYAWAASKHSDAAQDSSSYCEVQSCLASHIKLIKLQVWLTNCPSGPRPPGINTGLSKYARKVMSVQKLLLMTSLGY